LVTNLTNFAVGHLAGKDREGRGQVVCVVKASYTWNDQGVTTVLPEPRAIVEQDVYAGEPGLSGLMHAADLSPVKPRIDVLLAGDIVLPTPTKEADVILEVSRRLRKIVRVFGDRHWIPGVTTDAVPSQPRPTTRVPIAWERSYGGTDPNEPSCIERRNPVGSGLRRHAKDLVGLPVPNFEDPAHRLSSSKDRSDPRGFGPIAPHWLPRSKFAGTFDERWQKERRPLLPEDFDPAFFNVAPLDQQLDRFLPGEEVRLTSMTPNGRDRFLLPDLNVPVTFVADKLVHDTAAEVDTILIFPASKQLCLLARATFCPRPTILSLRQIIVGLPTPGRRKAIQSGKIYADWRAASQSKAS
jgi:hypothetical protein